MHLLTVMWAQGMHTLIANLTHPPGVKVPGAKSLAFLSSDPYCVTGVSTEIVVLLYAQERPVFLKG